MFGTKKPTGPTQAELDRLAAVEQAHQRHSDFQQIHRDGLSEANRKFAEANDLIQQARTALLVAVSSERRAGQAKRDALAALIAAGEADPQRIDPRPPPSQIAVRIEHDRLLRMLFYGRA